MKKLLIAFGVMFAFAACDDTKKSSEYEEVIDTDTVSTTYEVEEKSVEVETTVEVDTTTDTEEVEVEY